MNENNKNCCIYFGLLVGATLVLCVAVLLSVCASPASAEGNFLSWTNSNGTVGMTDDLKRVPERYQGSVTTRSFDSVEFRFTPVVTSAAERQEQLTARLERQRRILSTPTEVNPNHIQDCAGPVTVSRTRLNHEVNGQKVNSTFFVTRNGCGDVVSLTQEQPVPLIHLTR